MFSFAVEHANSEIIGVLTPRVQARIASRRWSPSGQGCSRCFDSIAPGVARRAASFVTIMAANYMSSNFQDEIKCLGIEASPSLRARTRGQWRRQGIHPEPEGELVLRLRHTKTIEELVAELIAYAQALQ